MPHKNKMQKYPVDTINQNESGLLHRLKSWVEKDAFAADPK